MELAKATPYVGFLAAKVSSKDRRILTDKRGCGLPSDGRRKFEGLGLHHFTPSECFIGYGKLHCRTRVSVRDSVVGRIDVTIRSNMLTMNSADTAMVGSFKGSVTVNRAVQGICKCWPLPPIGNYGRLSRSFVVVVEHAAMHTSSLFRDRLEAHGSWKEPSALLSSLPCDLLPMLPVIRSLVGPNAGDP